MSELNEKSFKVKVKETNIGPIYKNIILLNPKKINVNIGKISVNIYTEKNQIIEIDEKDKNLIEIGREIEEDDYNWIISNYFKNLTIDWGGMLSIFDIPFKEEALNDEYKKKTLNQKLDAILLIKKNNTISINYQKKDIFKVFRLIEAYLELLTFKNLKTNINEEINDGIDLLKWLEKKNEIKLFFDEEDFKWIKMQVLEFKTPQSYK